MQTCGLGWSASGKEYRSCLTQPLHYRTTQEETDEPTGERRYFVWLGVVTKTAVYSSVEGTGCHAIEKTY